jgi:hypothetical protein
MNALSRFANIWRRGVVAFALLLTLWVSGTGDAWAKGRRPEPEAKGPTGKNYMWPYGIVMLAVTLGMIAVCKQGRRAEEPTKPEPK